MKQAGLKGISTQEKHPLVSVIIPTYNRAAYLKEAIESVFGQSYPNIELIVVDDGSTDETREVINSYKVIPRAPYPMGSRDLRYFHQNNLERGAARNRGILSSNGKYIAFLDSDDLWLPHHIERCVLALEREPEYGVAFGSSYLMDEHGQIIGKNPKARWKGDLLKKIVRKYSSGGCNSSSCVVRREAILSLLFNEDPRLSGSEDWEMWVRLASRAHFLSMGEYTVKLRIHPEQSSQRVEKMEKSMTLALDLVFQNPKLIPRIEKWRGEAYSSLFSVIAVNYYGVGDFGRGRYFLKKAILEYPLSLFRNKRILYTFLKMFLGRDLIAFLKRFVLS